MMKRSLVAAFLVAAIGCGKKNSPTAPSTGAASGSIVRTVQIVGPDAVAPGTTAQFRLMAIHNDATQADVATRATWTSTNPDVLRVEAGAVTAVQDGEAGITAVFDQISARKIVLALEAGTSRINGTVTDSGFALSGARIDVMSGTGAGTATMTDGNGAYRLYGVAGEILMRASLDGYQTDVSTITITSTQQHFNFVLLPSTRPVDLAGDWQLTFDASPGCTTLPDIAQHRVYAASIEENVSALIVHLSGAEFAPDPAGIPGARMNQFQGRVSDNSVTLRLVTYEYYGTHYDLGEILPDRRLYTVVGSGTGTATASAIAGTLDGVIMVTVAKGGTATACASTDHRFSFLRSSSVARRRR